MLALGAQRIILYLMKTTTARFSETGSKVEGTKAVIIKADYKRDAQEAIKLAQAWVKANGGISKLTSFVSAPRWSSNLDLVFTARIAYRVAA